MTTAVQQIDEIRSQFRLRRINRATAIREIRTALTGLTDVGAADLLDDHRSAAQRYGVALRTDVRT